MAVIVLVAVAVVTVGKEILAFSGAINGLRIEALPTLNVFRTSMSISTLTSTIRCAATTVLVTISLST